MVVTRVEIDFKYPLRSHDRFVVTVETEKEGRIRVVFKQKIFRLPDNKLIVDAKITGVSLKNGRPGRADEIIDMLVG